MKSLIDFVADGVALVITWAICFGFVVGAYGLGEWLASYTINASHPEIEGLLSAIAFVWAYERLDRRLMSSEDRKREWIESIPGQSKDSRLGFIFWVVVIFGAMAWWFIRHPTG